MTESASSGPVISIIGPAIKTHYWLEFHKAFGRNNLSWEVVFVGPVEPNFPLPVNFRHICCDFKPMQCLEIAAQAARGEYLVVIPDDVLVLHESTDWQYSFKNHLPPFSVIGMRYRREGDAHELNDQSAVFPSQADSPILPICGMVKKSEWMAVGGIDSQFVGSSGDADLYMRCVEKGGRAFISPNSLVVERDEIDNEMRLAKRFRGDYRYFIHQWADPEGGKLVFRKHRRDKIVPFDPDTILTHHQGNTSGWV